MKILVLTGSIRKNSTNEKIIQAAAVFLPEGWEMNIYNEIYELPFFHPDWVKQEKTIPNKVKDFYKKIEEADGVVICTPEYVFSMPGVLKNALEWTVATTLFSHKPAAFIIASASGEKAFSSLDLIMQTLLQEPVNKNCKLLIKGARGKIDAAGNLNDQQVKHALKNLMNTLIKQINTGNQQKNSILHKPL